MYRILEVGPGHILLRDLGPWDLFPTVTNDAENVVKRLAPDIGSRRLFYFDSEGELGELVIAGGKFAGFRHCTAIPKGEFYAADKM
jgi:hypothetical protein